MKTTKRLFFALIVATPLLFASQAMAYGGHHPKDTDDHSKKAPVNGGIVLLVAAGVGLGIMKMRNKNKIEKEKAAFV